MHTHTHTHTHIRILTYTHIHIHIGISPFVPEIKDGRWRANTSYGAACRATFAHRHSHAHADDGVCSALNLNH